LALAFGNLGTGATSPEPRRFVHHSRCLAVALVYNVLPLDFYWDSLCCLDIIRVMSSEGNSTRKLRRGSTKSAIGAPPAACMHSSHINGMYTTEWHCNGWTS
jgi:hypothetical protein